MRNERYLENSNWGVNLPFSRQAIVGAILVMALFAFELFNYDTTRYALTNLLGDVNFVGLRWATILAVAFCAIDFAGLAYLFTPHSGEESKEAWYLMGAWLLGATMNALMTWWAVTLTLLNHDFGNEVLSRAQLLNGAPVLVAVLVWLTRILFIGSISVAGEHLFRHREAMANEALSRRREVRRQPGRPGLTPLNLVNLQRTTDEMPTFLNREDSAGQPDAMVTLEQPEEERPAEFEVQQRPVVHRAPRPYRRDRAPQSQPVRPAAMQARGRGDR